MMQTKIIERYFFFGLLLATLLFTFLIFRPFWVVLTLGISFSIILHPIFEWLEKKKMPSSLASIVTLFLFVILFCGPLLGIGAILFNQSQGVYQIVTDDQSSHALVTSINTAVNGVLPDSITFDAEDKVSDLLNFLSANVTKIFSTTVSAVFSFLLMLLVMFYFLRDGDRWRKGLIVLSPLADKDDEKIIHKLRNAVNAVMKGYLLIGILQGVLMGFGLWIFNVPNPALWGLVAAVASLLPTIGTAMVSIPAIIFLFVTGSTFSAVGLIIWSVLLVGMIDNFLSPLIVSGKTNIPPLLILFSVLGGVSLLGPIGILVGPLTISLLYTLISIYRNEFRQSTF